MATDKQIPPITELICHGSLTLACTISAATFALIDKKAAHCY